MYEELNSMYDKIVYYLDNKELTHLEREHLMQIKCSLRILKAIFKEED